MNAITKIEEYKCAVAIIQKKLYLCRLMADGTPKMQGRLPDWMPVEGPVGEDFLKVVNQALGSSFSEEDFRKDRSKGHPRRTRVLMSAST